jgi:hypothetical protein
MQSRWPVDPEMGGEYPAHFQPAPMLTSWLSDDLADRTTGMSGGPD